MADFVAINGSIVFTRDYEDGWVTGERVIRAGTRVVVTRIHRGMFGDITHVDVRLPNGRFLREVESDYFRG